MTAPYIHPKIEDVSVDPRHGERVDLVLVVEEGVVSEVVETISMMDGATLLRELDGGVLTMDVAESQLERIIEIEGVLSASPDKEAEILH
ncbi:hypothetical protein J2751_001947 [Halorubrum alkaliphilum]|uniref:Putative peptidase inhibitor domain-containing protein n=1 Tax=Halorubrum alkaliphilum TaxID=261290 RepID=A0A8T4GHP0_9EURY|nr:hypothetical protein [Halorubrum alkaliphilum]MBP1922931.1 hypothetical protein [Halorubrum alkaliphilum]